MTARPRLLLIATLCTLAAAAAAVIAVGFTKPAGSGTATTARPDLSVLNESMLIDESAVPTLAGTTWGRMVAVPRGAEPQVSPPGCELFLSQGTASQKGLAMRSSKNASIGVAVAITDERPNLAALLEHCRVFTFDGPGASSVVSLGPLDVTDLPEDAIATLMHCTTTKADRTLTWDIALIAGFHRGVLVSAEYTPGPEGGPFDAHLAAGLVGVYRAQLAGLQPASPAAAAPPVRHRGPAARRG